jgi:hypothetical protein
MSDQGVARVGRGLPADRREALPFREAAAADARRLLIVAGIAATTALAGSAWLWAHYGAMVFFETIRTGFAMACFG